MRITIILFGILLILAGLSLVVDPKIVFNFIIDKGHNLWLYIIAIAVRLILGVFMIITAASSRYPTLIKVFGYVFVIAAFVLIFMGQSSFVDLISTLIPEFRPLGRIGGLLSMAFGGFFVYAYTGRK